MANEIGRIESEVILSRIERSKEIIILQYVNNRFNVIVDSIAGTRLIVRRTEPSEEMLLIGRSVQLFFSYQDSEMTILPRVVRDRGEQIELMIEKPAYRDISSVSVSNRDNSSISTISIVAVRNSNTETPKYPHTTRTISRQKMEKYAQGLPADPAPLVQSYFHTLKEKDFVANVSLFRDRQPTHAVERISAYLGYPLIIPYPEFGAKHLPIASLASIEKAIQKMNLPIADAVLTDKDCIPGFEDQKIQIIFPIAHLTYCIGYLFMAARALEASQYETYVRVMERYGCALAVVLDRHGYFDSLKLSKDVEHTLKFVDTSASALYFSYQESQHAYQPGDLIQLMVSFPGHEEQKEFLIKANITHTEKKQRLHYSSASFVDPDPAFLSCMDDYLSTHKNDIKN